MVIIYEVSMTKMIVQQRGHAVLLDLRPALKLRQASKAAARHAQTPHYKFLIITATAHRSALNGTRSRHRKCFSGSNQTQLIYNLLATNLLNMNH